MSPASIAPASSVNAPAGDADPDPIANAASRLTRAVFVAAAAGLVLAVLGAVPAWAMVTPTFYTTSSPSTMVGYQIFDHANLMSAARGTITFRLFAPGDTGCASPIFSSTVTVSGSGSDDSAVYVTPAAGTYQWVASYSGDANDNPVSSTCGSASQSVIVGKVSPVATVAAASNGAGAIQGTTTLQGGFAPLGGTITFTVTGPNDTWCAGAPVYTHTVAVNGAGNYASGFYTPTAPGTYSYRIRYTGDNNNNGVGPTNCLDQHNSIALTASQIVASTFTNPTDGGVKSTTAPFAWTAVAGAQQYSLWIGTSTGANDLAAAYVSPSTLSYDVAMLPTGQPLFARLWTETNGSWSVTQDISFTSSDGGTFTTPADHQANVAPGPMNWAATSAAQYYAVWLGSTPGGYDLAAASVSSSTTSYEPPLPEGKTVYARLWTMVGGAWVRYDDMSFTTSGGATFTAPGNGQTGVDASRPLTWTAASGAQYYAAWVGTTPGGYDVASAAVPPGSTSYAPANLPHGRKLYARVWTMVDGLWDRYQDISFTTA